MIAVRIVKKAGPHKPGDVVRFDSLSAARLIEDGRAEALDEGVEAGEFDPSAHDVPAVKEYMADASPAEQHRVLAAERAGKARTGVLALGG